jgi:hypothetical protein
VLTTWTARQVLTDARAERRRRLAEPDIVLLALTDSRVEVAVDDDALIIEVWTDPHGGRSAAPSS